MAESDVTLTISAPEAPAKNERWQKAEDALLDAGVDGAYLPYIFEQEALNYLTEVEMSSPADTRETLLSVMRELAETRMEVASLNRAYDKQSQALKTMHTQRTFAEVLGALKSTEGFRHITRDGDRDVIEFTHGPVRYTMTLTARSGWGAS